MKRETDKNKLVVDIPFRMAWILMIYGSVLLIYITIQYYSLRTDINFLLAKQDFIDDIFWMSAFYLHITGSICCLFTGPFQFIAYFRKVQRVKWHRLFGKIYVFSILFVAAPSGLYMAIFANGGIGAQSGFFILSLLWIFTTYYAYASIIQKNISAHRAWMVRSYALTFSAVTLRTWVYFLSKYTLIEPDFMVVLTAWINWIPNLVVGEIILIFFQKKL